MIIKSTRIRVGGAEAAGRHILDRADGNEKIVIISGGRETLAAAEGIAALHAQRFGLRHYVISPDEPLSRGQLQRMLAAIRQEYGIPAEALETLVAHTKMRADGAKTEHYHYLVPEADPTTGRVLSSRHSYARNEKLARVAECEFGHQITPGRHNRAVIAALRREGRADLAARLTAAADVPRPTAAFDAEQHQRAKRNGVSLPQARQAIKDAWKLSDAEMAAALQRAGLRIEKGTKCPIITTTDASGAKVELGALHRLAKCKLAEARSRFERLQQPAPAPQPPGIAPADAQAAAERRSKQRAALQAGTYEGLWLPEELRKRVLGIERRPERGIAVIRLRSGARIIDSGDRLELRGASTMDSARILAQAAAAHGWQAVRISGDAAFKDKIAVELALMRPPIRVEGHQLSAEAQRRLDAELARRSEISRRADEARERLSRSLGRSRAEPEKAPKPEEAPSPAPLPRLVPPWVSRTEKALERRDG